MTDGCAIFGDPCFLNDHPQVWVAIQGGGYNSYSLLIKQLAVAQGYKGLLPDCEGVDMAGSHGVGADADCPARVTEEEYELMRAAWDNPSPQPLQQGGGEAASSAVASPAKAVMPWADMDAENSGSEGGQDYETQQGMESMPIFASQADVRMEVMTVSQGQGLGRRGRRRLTYPPLRPCDHLLPTTTIPGARAAALEVEAVAWAIMRPSWHAASYALYPPHVPACLCAVE